MTMRPTLTITGVLAALLVTLTAPALAQDMGGGDMGGGGMGGGGMGPPDGPVGGDAHAGPSMPKAIKRARFDQIVTGMFQAADTNRDGTVTIDELHAIVAARRATIIKDRFAAIDTDRNGAISMAEFTAWQSRMGAVANSDAAATGDKGAPISDAIMPDLGRDRVLAAVIEPLTGTTIASANTNYDAGISLAELLAYEGKLFDAADTDHDGYLWPQDLGARNPNGGGPNGRGPDGGGRMHRPGGPMGGPPPPS